jgi:peptidoglycan hydrolase CwlO-like protein
MITPGSDLLSKTRYSGLLSRLQNTIWRPGQTLLVIVLSLSILSAPAHAATCGEEVPKDEAALNTYISDCNSKLSDLSGQKQTLSSALDYLNTQIKITQAKVTSTTVQLNRLNIEISDLSGTINSLDLSLDDLTKIFISRVRETYMHKTTYNTDLIAQTSRVSDLLRGMEYNKKMRDHDQALLLQLEKSRLDASQQKEQKEIKMKEIAALKAKLDSDKAALNGQIASKNKLLADTKNDETKYQLLLSAAQRQLRAFSKFVSGQGGASILNNQTKCDSWGCYFNQRDSQWGNKGIGLYSSSMAEYGCLVTSVAMVANHYGKSLTPGDIASSSNPFWGSTAYMNQGSWNVNGVTITRTRIGSSTAKIDEELAAGRPVVVGIYGGPDHFLVIKAKEGSDYIMNDPFPENGGSIKFSSKYPLSAISAVDRVTIN